MGNKYAATLGIPDGEIHRKIDYLATNAKYRNTSREAVKNPHWRANVNQSQMHMVQTKKLY